MPSFNDLPQDGQMYVLGIVITSFFGNSSLFQPLTADSADTMADQNIGFRINGEFGY